MKEKQLKYVLMGVVALIWGFVIYKYFFWQPASELAGPVKNVDLSPLSEAEQSPDTFSLRLDYRDPFLSKVYASRSFAPAAVPAPNSSAAVAARPQAPPPPVLEPEWKSISYHGLIKESGGDKALGLLRFKNRSYSIQAGDMVEAFEIKAMWKDSVLIRHEKEARVYQKR